MDQAPSRTVSWSLAMTIAAICAFLAVIGVFLGWFGVTVVRETSIFGREIIRSETRPGIDDITGIVVTVVGLLIAALSALAALGGGSPGFRRFAASFATFGGLAVLAASGLGLTRAAAVARGTGVAVGRITFDGTPSLGLFVSTVAAAVAAVGGLLALRTNP
jgi:hypothetical protein